jgi:hypothetical protein
MSYTTIDQLTKDANDNLLETDGNRENKTLYYAKDLDQVMGQAGFARLEYLNVKFERSDGTNNNIHDITVLAGKGDAGNILDNVALPWPPYYVDQNENEYKPGVRLTK